MRVPARRSALSRLMYNCRLTANRWRSAHDLLRHLPGVAAWTVYGDMGG